jgi:hypothetical protein
LRGVAAGLTGEFAAPVAAIDGLLNLGGGTAIRLRSEGMSALRDRIAERFYDTLTAQDRGGKVLHITVQNKVAPQQARALQAELAPGLPQRRFAFTGLALHIYRGPHWEAAGSWPFRGRAQP